MIVRIEFTALTLVIVILTKIVKAQNITTQTLLTPSYSHNTTLNIIGEPDEELFPQRIVGGWRVTIRRAPWQVALIRNGLLYCGGSIISRSWILTAAHCVENGGNFRIRGGTRFFRRGGETRRVRHIFIHGQYNRRTQHNDVALMKLRRRFNFNSQLKAVRLAKPHMRLPRSYFVSGWGLLNENNWNPVADLRGVRVGRISRRRCRRDYRYNGPITNSMICAAWPGRDACNIDSGGALVGRRRQYGIVSFGIGCARNRFPGVYTDVRSVRGWINYVRRRF